MEENTVQEDVQLPPIDFIAFITDLITTAHLYLQGFRDPKTEEVIVNLGNIETIRDNREKMGDSLPEGVPKEVLYPYHSQPDFY